MRLFIIVVIVALVIIACDCPSFAEDPIGTITLTSEGFGTEVVFVYASQMNTYGWAHYIIEGEDLWISVTGGDWGNLPAKSSGHCYCIIDQPGCKIRHDQGPKPCEGTCNYDMGELHYSSTCSLYES